MNGEAFCCGCNKHGEIGQPLSREVLTQFEALRSSEVLQEQLGKTFPVKDVECGWWHTILLVDEAARDI